MNQYEELGFIGRGAYGQCFLARNVVTQKKYVMKKISLQKGYSAEKLITESLVLKTLTGHPNICSYVDSFVHGKELCIIMDHYAGGDLQKKIDDKRRSRATFSLDTILDFLLQLCIGLKHIHAQNILHRDIKPSNIFITKANVLKIGDFGIAKVLKEESFAMTGIGTPYYLSPEKITKTPYGPKSDMWSLGCLLYEMCTLKVPFRGADHNSLYCKIIEKPTPLLPRKYGKYLQTILNGLLHKDPKRRPSAARILRTRVMQARLMFHSTRYQQKLVGKEINRYQFGRIPGQITPKNPDRSPPRNAREGRSKSEDSVVRAPISPPVVSPVGRRVDPSPPFPSERSPPVASVCPASPKSRRAGSIPDKWQHGENSPPVARSPEQGVLQSPRYQRGDKSIQKNGKKSSSSADEAVEVLKRFQEHVDNQLVEAKAEGHQPEEKEARNEEQGESPPRAESPHRAGAQPPYPVGNENASEAEKESKRRYVRMLSKKMTSCRSYLEAVLGPAIVCLAAGYVRKLHRSGVSSKEALLLKVVKRFFAKKDTWTWDMKCCYAEEIVDMCEAERRLLRLYDC